MNYIKDPKNIKELKRTGGIAWGGSLVGSLNPNNLGYRYSNPIKRYRTLNLDGTYTDTTTDSSIELPSNIQIQLYNRNGDELANVLDIPINSTINDLTLLIHTLLDEQKKDDNNDSSNNNKQPYSFYIKNKLSVDIVV